MSNFGRENIPVVITGMGTFTALGQSTAALKDNLRKGNPNFIQNLNFPELSFPLITASINDFNFVEMITKCCEAPKEIIMKLLKVGRRAPKVIQTSLIAGLEAYLQANLYERVIDSTRVGIVVAGQNTTQRYQYDLRGDFQKEPCYLTPTYALHFMDTDQIGVFSEVFQIRGEGHTVGGASASGNVALIHAYRMLQQGNVDICLVVGVMADLSPMEIQGFYNIGAMGGRRFANKPMKASRPFDKDHEGFILGEGSGCLVLEASHIAQRDKVTIFGEVIGTAITLDAHCYSDPNSEGEARAMRQAIAQAGIEPKDIQYINTHGSSSVKGDVTELEAIREVFKDTHNQIWLNATKGIIGHCLWSAGLIEAITIIIQMQEGFLHPNSNLDNPIDNSLRWVGTHAEHTDVKLALSNSFGFGGINSSIVFAKENYL